MIGVRFVGHFRAILSYLGALEPILGRLSGLGVECGVLKGQGGRKLLRSWHVAHPAKTLQITVLWAGRGLSKACKMGFWSSYIGHGGVQMRRLMAIWLRKWPKRAQEGPRGPKMARKGLPNILWPDLVNDWRTFWGPFRGHLGLSWGFWGRSWGVLGGSWA